MLFFLRLGHTAIPQLKACYSNTALFPRGSVSAGCAPGMFFDSCPTCDILGGVVRALRVQWNDLDV